MAANGKVIKLVLSITFELMPGNGRETKEDSVDLFGFYFEKLSN
jgi:hypothetical protein